MIRIKFDFKIFLLSVLIIIINVINVPLSFAQNENTLGEQNRTIDSLLTLTKIDKPDTNKVFHLFELTHEYVLTGDIEKALNIGTEALVLAHKLSFKKGISQANNNIGSIYTGITDYPKALEYFLNALKLDEEANDHAGIALECNNIGRIYIEQADYPRALDYLFKGVKLFEEIKDKQRMSKGIFNIGVVYKKQGDYPKALDYYFKALKMSEEIGDKNSISVILGNIGIVYDERKEYSKAISYYSKALKMAEGLGDKNGIARHLGNIGTVYIVQEDYSKAFDYFFKGLKISEEIGNKNYQAIADQNIGSLYIKTGKFKEAEHYLKRAIALSDTIGALDGLRVDYEALSQLYDITGQHKLALFYYKKSIALKDSLFSQENKKQLVRKEMNYEFDKKELAAKAQQDKKDAVTAEEKQRQKIVIYSISVGLFLVLLLAFFIFRGYRLKQKANIIITQQKAEVENQRELFEEKNKEITDSINYAKRIQQAKLPKKEEVYAALPQCFVLFKPKDIVSGDFYFFKEAHPNPPNGRENQRISQMDGFPGSSSSPSGRLGGDLFIAAADCTGHGVPGAIISMIGSEKLEDAVSQTSDTSEILNLLNVGIKTSLHQSELNESTRDGMDIALVHIVTTGLKNLSGIVTLNYAGANRPIWIIRKGQSEIEEIKATKKAIGGFTADNQHFDSHEIKLHLGDTFYIFTDGYTDQFGGVDGKKLMTKRFKEILLEIQDMTMKEQEKYLADLSDRWRGKREQIDDILVIGVRL